MEGGEKKEDQREEDGGGDKKRRKREKPVSPVSSGRVTITCVVPVGLS